MSERKLDDIRFMPKGGQGSGRRMLGADAEAGIIRPRSEERLACVLKSETYSVQRRFPVGTLSLTAHYAPTAAQGPEVSVSCL